MTSALSTFALASKWAEGRIVRSALTSLMRDDILRNVQAQSSALGYPVFVRPAAPSAAGLEPEG